MALTEDFPRRFKIQGMQGPAIVQPSQTIYAGAALTKDTLGKVAPYAGSAPFAGFGREGSVTIATDTDKRIEVTHEGVTELVVAASGASAVGTAIEASDDNTFALQSLGETIGTLFRQLSTGSTSWEVKFTAAGL